MLKNVLHGSRVESKTKSSFYISFAFVFYKTQIANTAILRKGFMAGVRLFKNYNTIVNDQILCNTKREIFHLDFGVVSPNTDLIFL